MGARKQIADRLVYERAKLGFSLIHPQVGAMENLSSVVSDDDSQVYDYVVDEGVDAAGLGWFRICRKSTMPFIYD